jgi:hypothetical protein
MSQFKKIVEDGESNITQKLEGGEGTKQKSNASYREKCHFDTPRSSRLNKTHLKCARLIEALLCVVNIVVNIPIFMTNVNDVVYATAFYSLWGSTFALVSHFA